MFVVVFDYYQIPNLITTKWIRTFGIDQTIMSKDLVRECRTFSGYMFTLVYENQSKYSGGYSWRLVVALHIILMLFNL